jgi:hypothetical protein
MFKKKRGDNNVKKRVYYISPDSSSYKESRVLNDRNYILDLPTGTRLYVRDRSHDRDRKVRSDTPFFRSNEILPADGFIKKKTEPIPIKKIIQLIK